MHLVSVTRKVRFDLHWVGDVSMTMLVANSREWWWLAFASTFEIQRRRADAGAD